MTTMRNQLIRGLAFAALVASGADQGLSAPPQPPVGLKAEDKSWDGGDEIRLTIGRSEDDGARRPNQVTHYVVERTGEQGGLVGGEYLVEAKSQKGPLLVIDVEDTPAGEPFWFRVATQNAAGERSAWIRTTDAAVARMQWFDGGRLGFFIILSIVCGAILAFIFLARSGMKMWIRKMNGLDAIDEAVGRATEMGRPCLFIAGVQDLNEIETIAGITVLSRVAQKAAEYDATVVMPTSRSLVMTAARETTQGAYFAAGRPDAYQEDRIYYVTDEQFGFVAHVTGLMQREKPAACFYMGQFYAESLMLGETGNTIGAIQIAGSAQPAQLPFFVAACDYTLIGEEFFAASAYLSGDPDQLGSLKGQDVGKLLVAALLFVGCSLLTLHQLAPGATRAGEAVEYLTEKLLSTT
jgi:hypothetical protein